MDQNPSDAVGCQQAIKPGAVGTEALGVVMRGNLLVGWCISPENSFSVLCLTLCAVRGSCT